jgi:hypothetical protein
MYGQQPLAVYFFEGTYYFHFLKWNRVADLEPVQLIGSEKHVLSRYHWDLITLWTDYTTEENKPMVAFGRVWHTPIVLSNSEPSLLLSKKLAKNRSLPDKIIIYHLFKAFLVVLFQVTRTDFRNRIPYLRLLSERTIDGKTRLSTETISGVAFFGNDTNEIPAYIIEQLDI